MQSSDLLHVVLFWRAFRGHNARASQVRDGPPLHSPRRLSSAFPARWNNAS